MENGSSSTRYGRIKSNKRRQASQEHPATDLRMVMFREAGVFFFRPYRRPGRENGQGEERTIQPAIESWLFRKGGPVFLWRDGIRHYRRSTGSPLDIRNPVEIRKGGECLDRLKAIFPRKTVQPRGGFKSPQGVI
jgi:hypothetical protein